MKKVLAIILVLAMIFAFAACGEKEQGQEQADNTVYTLRMGNTAAYPSQPNVFERQFKEDIEKASNGRLLVQLYEASAFGGPNEMIQGLQNGSFQGVVIPIGFYASAAPGSAAADIPYLFDNPEEYYWVMNGETPLYDEYMKSQGIIIAGWMAEAPCDMHMTSKKIEKISDFKGLQIRTYSSSVYQNYVKALGATPIIMNTADVPLALQQGTIDGIQCGNTMSAPAKYGEIVDYVLVDATYPVPIPICLSRDFMESLPQDLQDLVYDTIDKLIKDGAEIGHDYSLQYIDDCYKELEAGGAELVHASEQLISDMKAATAGVRDTFLAEFPDMKAALEEIEAGVAAYRAKK